MSKMRFLCTFILFTVALPSTTPANFIEVLKFSKYTFELIFSIHDVWQLVNEYGEFVETPLDKKQAMVISKIDDVNLKLTDIYDRLEGIDQAISNVGKLVSDLPDQVRLELHFSNIRTYKTFINMYYQRLQKYTERFEDYENSTLIEFSKSVVSNNPNSVISLMGQIYHIVVESDFLHLNAQQFRQTNGKIFCNGKQSPQQMLYNLLQEILWTHSKSYIITQFGYIVKKMYGIGNFTQEAEDATEEFKTRTDNIILTMKLYMTKASRELWRCDPEQHIPDQTYVNITNLVRGYIINKVNLNPKGKCYDSCDAYSFTKTPVQCRGNTWCKKQPACQSILECEDVDSDVKICLADHKTRRRYEYIEHDNGKLFGRKTLCRKQDIFDLISYRKWLIWKCSFCFCLCDEGPKIFSDRFINLRAALANINDNRVMTGIRFVKKNRIIHLQIQEGKLLPEGKIDNNTIRWVPVENYEITDRYIYEGQDYHTLSWKNRAIDLNTVTAPKGYLVTGVRFRKVGSRIELEAMTTPFNFTTGKLDSQRSQYQDNPDTTLRHKFAREVKLIKPDISTRSTSPSTPDRSNSNYVQFTNSDYEKDAAQTTIPFLDAQSIESMVPVPVTGVGIFYKGQKGYGGFIAPKIFTYDYSQHLNRVFLKDL